jgi:glycosyltransferase involved in cell wall biosynthesis
VYESLGSELRVGKLMTERRVRILHALGSLDPGGVEMWLLNVLRHIDRERFRFDFCTFGPQAGLHAAEAEKLGSKILRCPKDSNPWAFRNRFRRILRDGGYDVVHSHVHFFSGAILCWAHAEGVPVRIAHSHTTQDDKPDTLARGCYRGLMKSWIGRYATHGLAASRLATVQLFGEDWSRDKRFHVVHCGINLRPFEEPVAREEVRAEFGIPADATVVGHVGRFVPAKNHGFFLDIAREVAKLRPDVHFLLVGDGPLRSQTEERARAMGFNGNMHFAGNRSDVPRLMRGGMDVFVFPSLWEGLPMTLIEAQAAGLPCVLSDRITDEATVLSGQSTRLSLSARSADWAAGALGALGCGRTEKDSAAQMIARTDFSVQRSASFLSDLYMGAE